MADTFGASGLSIDTFSVRLDALHASLRASIDPLLELTPNDKTGQLTRLMTDFVQRQAELLQTINTALDPDQASGVILKGIASITGTYQKPATQGTVLLTIELDGGTTLLAGAQARAGDDVLTTVETDVDVVAPAGPSDIYEVQATFIEYGEIVAPALSIKTIVTPVPGWNAVYNLADAVPGQEQETDEELRKRREEEVTTGGSTSVDAIQSDLSAITDVVQAIVLENTSHLSQDGMPPKSIEAIIWDGAIPVVDNDLIAETIWKAKPAGIQAYGTTVVAYTDDQGNPHQVGFTRATQKVVELRYTLTTGTGYPGNDTFRTTIAQWATANLLVGDDVIASRLQALAFTVPGVLDAVLELKFQTEPSWGTSNLVIGPREIATVDTTGVIIA